MSNIRNIQLLRNSQIFENLAAAKSGLTAQAESMLDGSPIIGRYVYTDPETQAESVKTLLGVAHAGVSGDTGITFFESATDIEDDIEALQAELDTTQASVGLDADGEHIASTSHFTSAATTVEEEIAALAAALESFDYEKNVGESEVFSRLFEQDGTLSADTKLLTAVKLSGLTTGTDAKILSTDTLGTALANIQAQIDAMDKTASAVDGQVVTTVTEADGKVSETKANVKDLQLGGYAKDASATGSVASTDTVNVALSKIENALAANKIENSDHSINITTGATGGGTDINVNIKEGEHVLAKDGNSGLYTNISIASATTEEVASLGTLVKEAYKLVGTDNTQLGEYIKIYKDSALKEVYLGSSADTIDAQTGVITKVPVEDPQSLNFAYNLADGTYTLVKVDVSKFLVESEFASGVTQNGAGVVTGVVDSNSESVITAYSTTGNTPEKVLSVGTNGFAVNHIQDAIDAAVGKAQTTVNTAVTAVDEVLRAGMTSHVTITETTADNGAKTYAFTETDIASEDALDAEVTRAKAAEAAFDNVIGSVKAQDSETRTYTKTGVKYATGATVVADVELLDAAIDELSGKTVTDFTSSNNSISATTAATAAGTVSVNLTTDASKISGLTAVADSDEGAAKISGVTEASSVKLGIENLYKSLQSEITARKNAIEARRISSANKGIAVAETANADGFSTTLTLTLDAATTGTGDEKTGTDNALTITDNGLFISTLWNCGTF